MIDIKFDKHQLANTEGLIILTNLATNALQYFSTNSFQCFKTPHDKAEQTTQPLPGKN